MANKPNEAQPTAVSVEAFLAMATPDGRRENAFFLLELMARLSGEAARMRGPSIIGCSPSKPAMVLCVAASRYGDPLVARLGRISTGKSCIFIRRLADIDLAVLDALIDRTLEMA